jgi:hypothetical protein
MARALRLPGLLDVILVGDAPTAAALVADPRLDRVPPRGPVLNRLIAGRARRMLTTGTQPLPVVLSRDDDARAARQAALGARLDAAAGTIAGIPDGALAPVIDYLCGGSDRDAAGVALQTLLGRLFLPDYQADRTSLKAAERVDRAIGTRNPLRWIADALTGRSRHARNLLSRRAHGDPVALHATMIALHNLIETVARMRALYADPGTRARLGPAAATAVALAAPVSMLREATRPADTVAGPMRAGTLALISLRDATDGRLQPGAALGDGLWSACPASAYTRALAGEIWRRATATGAG